MKLRRKKSIAGSLAAPALLAFPAGSTSQPVGGLTYYFQCGVYYQPDYSGGSLDHFHDTYRP